MEQQIQFVTAVEPPPLAATQIGEASDMLATAFHDDPPAVWLLPDEEKRRRALRGNFVMASRYGLRYGDTYVTPDTTAGVAIWLPPDNPVPSTPRLIRAAFLQFALAPLNFGFGAFRRFLAVMEKMEKLHKSDVARRHWYLMVIGVDPPLQRQGVGSHLIQPGLAKADRDRLPCYLETAKEVNLKFYGKHGFEVLREVKLARGGPLTWTMKREPIG